MASTYDTVSTYLTAAVATSGTFTVSYPANRSAGDYVGSHSHKMWANQTLFLAPASFSLSFGASSITVTYIGTTTLAIGTYVNLQIDRVGHDSAVQEVEAIRLPANMVKAPIYRIDLGAPDTADADGAAASQTVTGAGTAFVLNGAYASGGVVTFDVPRNVVGAWTNTAVLTITGTDAEGVAMVETTASGTSHTGSKAFKTITSITTSATVTAATVGSGVKIGLPRYVGAANQLVQELKDGVCIHENGHLKIPFFANQTDVLAPTNQWLAVPCRAVIARLVAVVQVAVTTGGDVTMENNDTAVDGLTVTIANSAAVGTIVSDAPTAGHASTIVAKDTDLEIVFGSAFATAGALNGHVELIDTTDGTFVPGVLTKATGTTGDTRGTYSPSVAPDGATSYALLVRMPDPVDAGVPQYTG